MNSLYLENSIIGSLFRFFYQYFSTATRSTQFLLTRLVIQQPGNTAVSGRTFCKVPKRQSTRAAKPNKLANTA